MQASELSIDAQGKKALAFYYATEKLPLPTTKDGQLDCAKMAGTYAANKEKILSQFILKQKWLDLGDLTRVAFGSKGKDADKDADIVRLRRAPPAIRWLLSEHLRNSILKFIPKITDKILSQRNCDSLEFTRVELRSLKNFTNSVMESMEAHLYNYFLKRT